MEIELQEAMRPLVDGVAQLSLASAQLERTAAAIEARLGAGAAPLGGEVARVVAAVDNEPTSRFAELEARLKAVEQQVAELRAHASGNMAAAAGRKTLPSGAAHLLAKHGIDAQEQVNGGALDAALTGLSLEQRIAVKSQLLRAGLLS